MNEPWIPEGFRTITANIIVDDAESAVSFLERASGATEHYRLTMSEASSPLHRGGAKSLT